MANVLNVFTSDEQDHHLAAPTTISQVFMESVVLPGRATALSKLPFQRYAGIGYFTLIETIDPGDGNGARNFETDVVWFNNTNFVWINPFPTKLFSIVYVNVFPGGVLHVMAIS